MFAARVFLQNESHKNEVNNCQVAFCSTSSVTLFNRRTQDANILKEIGTPRELLTWFWAPIELHQIRTLRLTLTLWAKFSPCNFGQGWSGCMSARHSSLEPLNWWVESGCCLRRSHHAPRGTETFRSRGRGGLRVIEVVPGRVEGLDSRPGLYHLVTLYCSISFDFLKRNTD